MKIIARVCVGCLLLGAVLWLCWVSTNTREQEDRPPSFLPHILQLSGYSRLPDGGSLVRAPCGTCAVVSSSGQMLGSGLGPQIEQAECVMRMNTAPTVRYEPDVGTRSTFRVVSHTSVPLLLRNQTYFFQQSQDTIYVIWGPSRQMDTDKGITYRALMLAKGKYPEAQIYTLTQDMMAHCDQIFQNETGKNRAMSGSFLSTGWFTMILAMELCEEISVYGMVSENYCRDHMQSSVPYHYYEKGRLDECSMYIMHERAPRGAHRFITEKAVFSRWAKRKRIHFNHPSWGS
ncbi:alpha-N-acetyl-neuraminyl-2,3-beta-galactosyl-1,3-N-acetyl-galactosaminide alpha-2,6-sialyltransferase [Bombina bombina]|uniref:alpha-N-acetyl-neuraminyl-2,3-beta-galactosyl-1, 3-N-acetyl-galactosaminide alpha-2,6-sialyltransferase n=1 Tax=Bombina bombina TaxID=8345 RepID=UPI00235AD234|nr:alpha-N-acetyl-neuraminyl-2,3-beta-galactosyl-1,3-N-acetyl-galactosaminide alpha-2,6-sialyltransferase [Bombina bombina]XP_053551601.1 alpha-N-acetyl-neuraminyl-2,3-beta-galactosyl-1,3-N-acetyl-galactosaminide alpha-2,6-sialyltransferase [Bombina bombina]XP_053551602.1 alpha-N-acetyl-neuraminyl-2,3-beta-galactosyl-1,3-N-acetyl-galactosaminide alpha-2,6-sialyltransferase [Bombina bombina]XP_053551603.1 alpha-N-acetyl-neuraminyl-2,3-beta-galactosyl-1,3-N-acetyl-galactosaminide alpha-2,6-sialylt